MPQALNRLPQTPSLKYSEMIHSTSCLKKRRAVAPPKGQNLPPSRVAVEPTSSRLIQFRGLKEPIDVYDMPLIGNPQAKHVIIEMLDYTCPFCRKLHPHVHASVEKYPDQVAFIVFHVPLSKKCNPNMKFDHISHKHACDYARLALSIWKLDRDKFSEYHDWLMQSEKPPSIFKAKSLAMEMVGEAVLLDNSLEASAFRKFAGQTTEMRNIHTGLPALLTERGIIRGVPRTEREWFEFLEKRLGIK